MGDYLIRAHLKVGEPAECGLQCADEFCLELTVQLVAGVFLLHIAAHVGVEEQRIGYLV